MSVVSYLLVGACSHSRAHEYFGESVHRRNSFNGCVCTSYEDFVNTCDCTSRVPMGWATPRATRGIYYLTTRASKPFGLD